MINTVTPNTAVDNTATTYTAAGTGLADTVTVELYTVVGTQANFPITPTSITDTEIVFDATLTPADTYSIRALDANTSTLASLSDAITVTSAAVVADITSITPNTGESGTTVTFTVVGTNLADVTQVELEGP
jgi:hypothetical protein